MSLFNVWVSPTKAMVIVDTEVKAQDGRYFEGSKMLTLPHANIVVAARGNTLFLSTLFSLLHVAQCTRCDDFEALMFSALKTTTDQLKTLEQTFAFKHSIYDNEVALVGYSHYYGGMHCVAYESRDETGFTAQEISDAYYAPWDESWGPAPTGFPTPGIARAIASEQMADLLQMHPDKPFGGRLLLAELTREDIKVCTGSPLTGRALNQPPGPRIWEAGAAL
ncbi:hypothetical protein H6CHR_03198 [Variovorax sp. PBL-H6]|uniref:hypothetical protein n=1 Tax=Variovorax sp. PBL-H6 TaxID=434009 RepID=UPI001317BB29|nr:hypothetical protein [Variovorax sp. PBL-H6]VTU29453.1 hypothetical protein H6CHR_03198 [Variovorax sp. PBL-H6]